MNVRDEINRYADPAHKPTLLWLLDHYSKERQWQFVARCRFEQDGEFSYQCHRIWEPTKEGEILHHYYPVEGA